MCAFGVDLFIFASSATGSVGKFTTNNENEALFASWVRFGDAIATEPRDENES